MSKTKFFAVAAMAALLTACQGGQATPPPLPAQLQPQSNEREFTTLSLFEAQNATTGERVRVFPTRARRAAPVRSTRRARSTA